MVRKLRAERVTEVAVMEVAPVGVRTRTRTQAEDMAAAAATSKLAKRRKLNSKEVRLYSSYIQLRNRTINTGTKTASKSRCSSPRLELLASDRVSTSCCSSSGSSERIEFADLKDESVEVETSTHYNRRERRETIPSREFEVEVEVEAEAEAEAEADDLDSKTTASSEANSHRRSTVEKMPTESDIEDFFAEAEKKLLKQFSEKYNFDFAKEEPMKGRYEWVRLRP